jgi:hypothetical protein
MSGNKREKSQLINLPNIITLLRKNKADPDIGAWGSNGKFIKIKRE